MVRISRACLLASLALAASCGDELVLKDPEAVAPEPDESQPVDEEPVPVEPIVVEPVVLEEWEDPARGPPYPIVLVHGFSGFTDLGPLDYFFQVAGDLEEMGHVVYAPALPPYNGSDDRARVLAQVIDDVLAETNKRKVHLIAHSQGGVDSRRVIAGMDGYAAKVASLTTVASPHRGTPLADIAQEAPGGLLNPAGQFLGWLIGLLDQPPSEGDWDDEAGGDPWTPEMVDAVEQLSSAGMEAFNEQHPDPEGVPIFSVVGYSNLVPAPSFCEEGALFERTSRIDPVDPLLVSTGLVLSGGDLFDPRANDGIVPSDSMVWGTLLGCVPADHFDEVGQIGDLLPHVLSGFDHLEMFRLLVDNARAVEALEE